VNKSHIVPDFLYDAVRDEGRIYQFNEQLVQQDKWRQSGYYEPLLCSICESDFNKRFESPCVKFFRSIDGPFELGKEHIFEIPKPLRKLVISVLYRAIFAKDAHWNAVMELWNAELTKSYLANGLNDSYKVYARILCDDLGLPVKGFISSPSAIRLSKTWFTCMAFGGMEFVLTQKIEDVVIVMDEIPHEVGFIKILASRLINAWSLNSISAT